VAETNMLGEPMTEFEPVTVDDLSIIFNLKPYEVRTFKIMLP